LNFVVNAKDAMPAGGRLTIEATNARVDESYSDLADVAPGQYVCVSVSDTGVGMTEEVKEKAFDPFFTTKGLQSGTGLGLSIAHGFVRQSNGHIKLYSEPDAGTSIKIYLPRTHSSPSVPAAQSESTVNLSTLAVLVVEDDEALRSSVSGQLRSFDCTVLSAASGEEALRLVDFSRVDVLLTDVVMPGMGGATLAKEALAKNPELAVVFMSGYTENSIIHHGRVDPGVVLLQKPFRRADLLAAFERAIRHLKADSGIPE
jgi:CheY-like chemotaxis protein/anti-sigma regulatory factor (Ser/Thr protein kinase)